MHGNREHHRRSIRLQGYDYSQPGAYFLTLCTENRECLFGDVVDGVMVLNEVGQIVEDAWLDTPALRPNVELDAFVVMPNHFHAIAVIVEVGQTPAIDGTDAGNTDAGRGGWAGRGVLQYAPTPPAPGRPIPAQAATPRAFRSPSQTIGAIVRGFKGVTTKQINPLRFGGVSQYAPTNAPVWQRNYYEHIIRNERELNRIREYIEQNPARWATDEENPLVPRRVAPRRR